MNLIKELKTIQIGTKEHQNTHTKTTFPKYEEVEIVQLLKKNVNIFVWAPTDMAGINPNVVCHQLSIKPRVNHVAQRKRKEEEEKSLVVSEEVKKLLKARAIQEIKYLTWLTNIVLVKKNSGKW